MPSYWSNKNRGHTANYCKMPQGVHQCHGIQIPSLLGSGSEVTLLWQSYFNQYMLLKISLVTQEKAKAHSLFKLTVTNDGWLLVTMYTELDISFLGLTVPKVGISNCWRSKPGARQETPNQATWNIGWNLVQLSYQEVIQKYRASGFDSFECAKGICPLLFSQLCIYHDTDVCNNSTLEVRSVSAQNLKAHPKMTDDIYQNLMRFN